MGNFVGKSYENKKVRAKGKTFRSCYFENCIIKDDEHTIYIDCYMYAVKTSKRSKGANCVVVNSKC